MAPVSVDNIFAVIVTYNGQQFIEKCINSLLESSCDIKIVVVDNNSGDDTVALLTENYPQVTLLELKQNLGFGRGNNIGMTYAYKNAAKHVVLLNQDAYVMPETVEKIIHLQKSFPAYGVLSPLHLNGTERTLDTHFGQFIGRSNDINVLLSDYVLGNPAQKIYQVDFVNAAVWVVSRQCVETVGLFNPSFIHYGEDVDYVNRAQYFGFHVGICPGSRAVHDRLQHSIRDVQPVNDKCIQKMKAEIVNRLSRFEHGTLFNLFSISSYILLSAKDISLLIKVKTYLHLFGFALQNIRPILMNRSIAMKGEHCFFNASQYDALKYLK